MTMIFVTDSSTESGNTTVSTFTFPISTPCVPVTETIYKTTIVTLPPVVGRIKVEWEKVNPCQGYILFSINLTKTTRYLCHNDEFINNLSAELCEERRCGEFLGLRATDGAHREGYVIHKNLTVTSETQCKRTFLTCKGVYVYKLYIYIYRIIFCMLFLQEPMYFCFSDADRKELVAYKVITGLLLTLIIAVLLCRFAQPTCISVRKRCESWKL